MRCSKCGRENRAGRRFCAHCGAKLTLVCASCQAVNEPGEQFCGECGEQLAEPAKPRPPPDPLSYTPKYLAEKILTTRSALEGERKQVTVLFADVKGSMELTESVDPEEWHRILDRFFAILADGIHRFEGTINQFTGDGVMALFGAPIAHEDHAQRACYAALHLQQGLSHDADELRLERGLNFSVRMGLNSGEVVVGKIGDDLRIDYTAQGHTPWSLRCFAIAPVQSLAPKSAPAPRSRLRAFGHPHSPRHRRSSRRPPIAHSTNLTTANSLHAPSAARRLQFNPGFCRGAYLYA
jgi:class 3 adenylate cyclase